ncbi:MAG TPA: YciI family protein [Armatimonadota bacterium]|jgi:hypothetical protein
MALFVIIGTDGPEAPKLRLLHRTEHLQRLQALDAAGKVVLAGPFEDKTGSLIVIEADSLDEARAFAQGDPYVTYGVFTHVKVKPFRQVLPAPGA